MIEELLKALPIYISCLFKFIVGPVAGYGTGLHIVTTILVTILGMMTSVVAITFFGDWLRMKLLKNWISRQKKFSARSRRVVMVWKKFGLAGIALLTPILFTPIGGALIAVSLGAPKYRILLYMLISASVFAILFTILIYSLGESVLPYFKGST
jgi:membrane protein DedA with SNARE-associated domain